MSAKLDALRALGVQDLAVDYDDRQTLLYALSLGLGDDMADPGAMDFLSELQGRLQAVPTLATVLARTPMLRDSGIDFTHMLHGEQRLVLHRPLPPHGRLLLNARVACVTDLGTAKGALVCAETTGRLHDDPAAAPLFSSQALLFCRGDGGMGSHGERPAPLGAVPTRPADATVHMPTRHDHALLYRLNGDRNPIHVDGVLARQAGLERPLLHGLCTFGMCARAILRHTGWDARRTASIALRFAAPLYPGETLSVDLWPHGHEIAFQARSAERGVVVASHGRCTLRPEVPSP